MLYRMQMYQDSRRSIVFQIGFHSFGSRFFDSLWVYVSGDYCYQQYNYTLSFFPSFTPFLCPSQLFLLHASNRVQALHRKKSSSIIVLCGLPLYLILFLLLLLLFSLSISTTCGAAASSCPSNSFGSPAVQSKNCISCFSFFSYLSKA